MALTTNGGYNSFALGLRLYEGAYHAAKTLKEGYIKPNDYSSIVSQLEAIARENPISGFVANAMSALGAPPRAYSALAPYAKLGFFGAAGAYIITAAPQGFEKVAEQANELSDYIRQNAGKEISRRGFFTKGIGPYVALPAAVLALSAAACGDTKLPTTPTPSTEPPTNPPPQTENYVEFSSPATRLITNEPLNSGAVVLGRAGPNGENVTIDMRAGQMTITKEHKVKEGTYAALIDPNNGDYQRQTPLEITVAGAFVNLRDGRMHPGVNVIEPDNVSAFDLFRQYGFWLGLNRRYTRDPDIFVYDKSLWRMYTDSNGKGHVEKVADNVDMNANQKRFIETIRDRRDIGSITWQAFPGNFRFESQGSLPDADSDIDQTTMYIPVNNNDGVGISKNTGSTWAKLRLNDQNVISLGNMLADTFEAMQFLNPVGESAVNLGPGVLNSTGLNMGKIKYGRPRDMTAPDITA